jgi:hypothetical protein
MVILKDERSRIENVSRETSGQFWMNPANDQRGKGVAGTSEKERQRKCKAKYQGSDLYSVAQKRGPKGGFAI